MSEAHVRDKVIVRTKGRVRAAASLYGFGRGHPAALGIVIAVHFGVESVVLVGEGGKVVNRWRPSRTRAIRDSMSSGNGREQGRHATPIIDGCPVWVRWMMSETAMIGWVWAPILHESVKRVFVGA